MEREAIYSLHLRVIAYEKGVKIELPVGSDISDNAYVTGLNFMVKNLYLALIAGYKEQQEKLPLESQKDLDLTESDVWIWATENPELISALGDLTWWAWTGYTLSEWAKKIEPKDSETTELDEPVKKKSLLKTIFRKSKNS